MARHRWTLWYVLNGWRTEGCVCGIFRKRRDAGAKRSEGQGSGRYPPSAIAQPTNPTSEERRQWQTEKLGALARMPSRRMSSYPEIAREATEYHARRYQEQMKEMRDRKRQKEIDGIQKQIDGLRQRLAALDVTEAPVNGNTENRNTWGHLISA